MKPAALDPLAKHVLRALFELAQLDCPADAGLLARAVAPAFTLRAADVSRVLLVLDARGLVVADRARLTLRGLAEAARCASLGLDRAAWLPALKRQAVQLQLAERSQARAIRAQG